MNKKIRQGLHSLPTIVHKVLLKWNFLHYHSTCLVTLSVHQDVQSSCRVQTHYVDDFRLTTPNTVGDIPTCQDVQGVLIRNGQLPHTHERFYNFGKNFFSRCRKNNEKIFPSTAFLSRKKFLPLVGGWGRLLICCV